MKILVIFRVLENSDFKKIEKLLLEEERFAWKMYLKGTLREHYESDMPTPAISVVEMESIETAKSFFSELPLLKEGLISADYYPLRAFKNWEVLFKDSEKQSLGE